MLPKRRRGPNPLCPQVGAAVTDELLQKPCAPDSPDSPSGENWSAPENTLMAQQLEIYAREIQQYYWDQRRLEKELRSQVEELRQSRQRIVAVEEALRKEIAELLHGRVQTRLVVAWHKLGQCLDLLDTDMLKAKSVLRQTRDEIDLIRERDVRQAAHLLHPSVIQIGVRPAIQSLVSTYADFFKITVTVDPQFARMDDPLDNHVPEETRLIIYRVLEEAITNVYRHAKATEVRIGLSMSGEKCVTMVVEDNGIGFDASRSKPGLGLTSIADRVGAAGGVWKIDSALDHGACLFVGLPFGAPEPNRYLHRIAARHQVP